MSFLKNKNTVILIISAILIIIAIFIAISAFSDSPENEAETTAELSIDLESLANLNNTTETTAIASSGKIGKYKVSAGGDDLSLRMEPNATSDRIYYITDGTEVNVLAVWEDWGYVVYEQSGGWLSMNYLEYVG